MNYLWIMSFVSVFISMWMDWKQKPWFARVPQTSNSSLTNPSLDQLSYNVPVVLICASMESKSWAPIAWLRFTRRLLRGLEEDGVLLPISDALAIVKSDPPRSLFVRLTFGDTVSDREVLAVFFVAFLMVYFLLFGLRCCMPISFDESPWTALACFSLRTSNSEVLKWQRCDFDLLSLDLENVSLYWKDEEDRSSSLSFCVSIPFGVNNDFPEYFHFPVFWVSNERAWSEIMGSSSSVMLPDSMLSSLVLVPVDEDEDRDSDEEMKFKLLQLALLPLELLETLRVSFEIDTGRDVSTLL